MARADLVRRHQGIRQRGGLSRTRSSFLCALRRCHERLLRRRGAAPLPEYGYRGVEGVPCGGITVHAGNQGDRVRCRCRQGRSRRVCHLRTRRVCRRSLGRCHDGIPRSAHLLLYRSSDQEDCPQDCQGAEHQRSLQHPVPRQEPRGEGHRVQPACFALLPLRQQDPEAQLHRDGHEDHARRPLLSPRPLRVRHRPHRRQGQPVLVCTSAECRPGC